MISHINSVRRNYHIQSNINELTLIFEINRIHIRDLSYADTYIIDLESKSDNTM